MSESDYNPVPYKDELPPLKIDSHSSNGKSNGSGWMLCSCASLHKSNFDLRRGEIFCVHGHDVINFGRLIGYSESAWMPTIPLTSQGNMNLYETER